MSLHLVSTFILQVTAVLHLILFSFHFLTQPTNYGCLWSTGPDDSTSMPFPSHRLLQASFATWHFPHGAVSLTVLPPSRAQLCRSLGSPRVPIVDLINEAHEESARSQPVSLDASLLSSLSTTAIPTPPAFRKAAALSIHASLFCPFFLPLLSLSRDLAATGKTPSVRHYTPIVSFAPCTSRRRRREALNSDATFSAFNVMRKQRAFCHPRPGSTASLCKSRGGHRRMLIVASLMASSQLAGRFWPPHLSFPPDHPSLKSARTKSPSLWLNSTRMSVVTCYTGTSF